MEFKKFDSDLQLAYGEVYTPGVIDSQGDFMTEDDIREMAHRFMRNKRVGQVDVMHDEDPSGAVVVESFLVRDGDPDFIKGSWVAAIHVPDKLLWDRIVKGELNGFSIGASGKGHIVEIEIEVPEYVIGRTDEAQGHTHEFKVSFAEDGIFLGGSTDEVLGHVHKIEKGTATAIADGHSHRFSYIEELADAV